MADSGLSARELLDGCHRRRFINKDERGLGGRQAVALVESGIRPIKGEEFLATEICRLHAQRRLCGRGAYPSSGLCGHKRRRLQAPWPAATIVHGKH